MPHPQQGRGHDREIHRGAGVYDIVFETGVDEDQWWHRVTGPDQIEVPLQLSGPAHNILANINARYPADIGSPPHEKQMLFEVKKGRHLGRRGNVGEGATKDETVASAALYMPTNALNTTTAVDWSPADIGIVGGAMIQAFTTGDPVTSDNLLEKLKDTALSGAGGIAIDLAAKMITPLISTVTAGGNAKAILQSMFGQQIDPRTDMLFNKVQYRTHQFSFTLIPRNQVEAKNINQILNLFQFYMLPKYGGEGGGPSVDSFFIGYPYEFDITLITQEGAASGGEPQSPHINKIDRSVLTSCQINHASNQRVAFVGAYYPASTSLVLEFTEVRLQGRDSYDKSMWHGSKATPYDPNSPITADEVINRTGLRGVVDAVTGFVGPRNLQGQ